MGIRDRGSGSAERLEVAAQREASCGEDHGVAEDADAPPLDATRHRTYEADKSEHPAPNEPSLDGWLSVEGRDGKYQRKREEDVPGDDVDCDGIVQVSVRKETAADRHDISHAKHKLDQR